MFDHPNQLLAGLPSTVWDRLRPVLSEISVTRGESLAETHGPVSKVYFPHSGIISCVVELIGGGAIETGMIGRDGQFGAGLALDHKLSPNYVVMQVAGDASIASADTFRALMMELPELRTRMMSYENFFIAQVQQTAACNAAHEVQQRTCKWLLRMHHLIGTDLELTQDFLAQMMGVRRTSVSPVASELQKAGMISYARGRIHIIDIEQIKRRACECDDAITDHYETLVLQ